jgi:putative ABC transport system permease protein
VNVWSFALRNVARNRRRSLLTGGVVVCGFAAIALAGGFMAQSLEGLREGTIRNGVGHLQIAHPSALAAGPESSLEQGLSRAAEIETIVRAEPAVDEVLARIEFVGLLTDGRRSMAFVGTGLDPAAEARTMDPPKAIAAGRWLAGKDELGVVLGSGLASALSVGVDDHVTLVVTTTDGVLNAVDARVAGLADIPIRELNDRFLATSLGLAEELLTAGGRVSKLVVVLRGGADVGAVRDRLEARLQAAGFEARAQTWEELAVFYRQVRLLYLGIFGFTGIILVAVVLLASMNTMLMATTERIREIGTLRAIGTRPARIRALFLAEGTVVAVLGCLAGAALALALCTVLNHSGIVLPPPPGVTHGMPLHVKFYGAAYAAGALAMLATMTLASYLPARRASRIPIVEALVHV